jgi:hypothetical protein
LVDVQVLEPRGADKERAGCKGKGVQVQYSSASMMVSTRAVCSGSAGFSESPSSDLL